MQAEVAQTHTAQLPNVSIIVAALNEEVLIGPTVKAIDKSCQDYLNKYQLILVNDGSTDRTGTIMEELAKGRDNVIVIHHKSRSGIGNVLQTGLNIAKYEYTMLLCGDGGLPGESLPPIFQKIGQADIVVPYMSNMRQIKTPFRYFLSCAYTTILNITFRKKLNYYNGLPVFRTKQLKSIKIVSRSFAFQAEIILKLLKSGCTYVQVPTLGSKGANKPRSFSVFSLFEVIKISLILIFQILLFNRDQQVSIKEVHEDPRTAP